MKYDKTILITGGMGFIGSNFLNVCVPKYKNYFFINIDSLTNSANPKNISIEKEKNYIFQKIDIRDLASLEKLFTTHKISDVIHFAAESHVDVSLENPKIFIETNIYGTHNLLMFAFKYKIKRFYQVSTDEVYGSLKKNEAPFTTKSNLNPNNQYSASKAGADLLVRAYHQTFDLDTIISRCTNNYGPNQDNSKLIPKFIRGLLKGQKVPLYAKGDNIRDWIYVMDHVEAIDLLFHKGISGSTYNIGASNEMSNIDVVKKLISLSGQDKSLIQNVPDRRGHDFRYAVDTKELSEFMGWKAKTNFEKGIKKTFEFYKKIFD